MQYTYSNTETNIKSATYLNTDNLLTLNQKQRTDYVSVILPKQFYIPQLSDGCKDTKHLLQSFNLLSSKALQGLCHENRHPSSSGDGPESHHGLQSSFH